MDRTAIGERLRMLRGSRTQIEVAKALGLSQSAYSAYESGTRTPRDEIKAKIAKYYRRTVQSVFFA